MTLRSRLALRILMGDRSPWTRLRLRLLRWLG